MSFFACNGNVASTTSVAAAKPASMLAGDILIAYCCAYRSTSATPGSPTIANTGAGGASWSAVTKLTTGTYYQSAYAYKTLAADDDGSVTAYTWSSTNATQMTGGVIVLRGRKNQAPTPIRNTAYITDNTTIRATTLTVAAADDLVWAGYNYCSTVQETAIPAGWTSGTVQTAAAAIGCAMAYKENVSAGATGSVDGSVANAVTTKHAFMFAVQMADPAGCPRMTDHYARLRR